MSKRVQISLFLALILGWMSLGLDRLAWGIHEQIVTATHVRKAPTGLDDTVWKSIQEVPIYFNGGERLSGKHAPVATKAIYTDDHLYFRFKWTDPTKSVSKQAWKFDGEKWSHLKGNEDRITLLFEIARINKFATKGCVMVCHGPGYAPQKEWHFATKTSSEIGDLWDWRAAGSDPYKYAVDGWLTVDDYPSVYGLSKRTGRRMDPGTGRGFKNQTEDKSKPLYMQDSTKNPSTPGLLLMEEAVKITDYSIFKAGEEIPFVLPKITADSRFDVKAVSRYTDGEWIVMLSRKLDTGHDYDVIFNPLKHYSFAMALFDDSVDNYSRAGALALYFSR